ncbi:MAG: L-serine ammonia-lyase [Bacteroidota bacterium]
MNPITPITTSIFDLFKVGPGPSSSHTIGPMKAAYDFLRRITQLPPDVLSTATSIDVILYGSLAATGKGHGTDRAITAGLLGKLPEECEPVWFSQLMTGEQSYTIAIGAHSLQFSSKNIQFERGKFQFSHPNTLQLRLMNGIVLITEEEYYSIGGGFIRRKGETAAERGVKNPEFSFSTMNDVKEHLLRENITLPELILRNEMAVSGLTRGAIQAKLDAVINFMHEAVKRGLAADGELPGSIKLNRKAASLYRKAQEMARTQDSFLIFLNAYCEAASEENAAGNIVVTAPTSGASGVIPGLTYLMKTHYHYDAQKLRDGMFVAAAIGFLVKHNASISGAEMGCMGEIGTACAMGAAMLSYCAGCDINTIEAAAEIAIEHHLGMTCDPIGGYVQIPCIERNAMGAVKAYNAYLLASSGNHAYQKISLDSVIKVMKATGDDMSKKYKETSEAGLALSSTEC